MNVRFFTKPYFLTFFQWAGRKCRDPADALSRNG